MSTACSPVKMQNFTSSLCVCLEACPCCKRCPQCQEGKASETTKHFVVLLWRWYPKEISFLAQAFRSNFATWSYRARPCTNAKETVCGQSYGACPLTSRFQCQRFASSWTSISHRTSHLQSLPQCLKSCRIFKILNSISSLNFSQRHACCAQMKIALILNRLCHAHFSR